MRGGWETRHGAQSTHRTVEEEGETRTKRVLEVHGRLTRGVSRRACGWVGSCRAVGVEEGGTIGMRWDGNKSKERDGAFESYAWKFRGWPSPSRAPCIAPILPFLDTMHPIARQSRSFCTPRPRPSVSADYYSMQTQPLLANARESTGPRVHVKVVRRRARVVRHRSTCTGSTADCLRSHRDVPRFPHPSNDGIGGHQDASRRRVGVVWRRRPPISRLFRGDDSS